MLYLAVMAFGQDHPRSRRNNWLHKIKIAPEGGSPPLAREQPTHLTVFVLYSGITPARAGTIIARIFSPTSRWDHPRSRGNNTQERCGWGRRPGSPPLAREQLRTIINDKWFLGITPARAGTTVSAFQNSFQAEDHPRSRGNNEKGMFPPIMFLGSPRSRGNNLYFMCLTFLLRGSPPLAREQRLIVCRVHEDPGITPARAGTT